MSNSPRVRLRQAPKRTRPAKRAAKKRAAHHLQIAVRRCKQCGCTQDNCAKCIAAQGFACYWVAKDLCSRCANEGKR